MNMQKNTLRCELINKFNIAYTSKIYQGVLNWKLTPSMDTRCTYIFPNNYKFECVLLDCFIMQTHTCTLTSIGKAQSLRLYAYCSTYNYYNDLLIQIHIAVCD